MNRKWILLIVPLLMLFASARAWLGVQNSFFRAPLETENFRTQFPVSVDEEDSDWATLSYGYHLAPWPVRFQGDPVVTTMNYQKGPPDQFISEMTQIWSPGNAELSIEGARTPLQDFNVLKWKSCLSSYLFCLSDKQKLVDADLKDLVRWKQNLKKISWFESESLSAPRGVHLQIDLETSQVDRYVVFTDKGNTQNFTLKTSRTATGEEARNLFLKVLQGMTLKDDLSEPRAWVRKKLQGIQLEKRREIPEAKVRYEKLIQVQNLLFSELALDPRMIAPFFHLAGVTHLLGVSLIKEKINYFKNQESWILGIHPLLSALIQYVKDFPAEGAHQAEREAALADMESLLEDFLLLEQKVSKRAK